MPCVTEEMHDLIWGVIVTYYPNEVALRQLLCRLQLSLPRIVVVDNTPLPDGLDWPLLERDFERVSFVVNGVNIGLSKALNKGIGFSLQEGAHWVMLFDQDSFPDTEMISRLASAINSFPAGSKIAAVGPVIWDVKLQHALPFVRYGIFGFKYVDSDSVGCPVVETHMLITSGCLISSKALIDIGLMDEEFFIDGIDVEWCFRCLSKGYKLFGIGDVLLRHNLGSSIRTIPGTRLKFFVHSPFRQYNIARNRVLLYWRSYVPVFWKLYDIPRLLFRIFVFSFFVHPRMKNFLMIIRGVWDGCMRR